jgi:hypothetical protein
MINIIAHRGFWLQVEQKNSEKAFRLALDNGFGIETDLRDYNGEVVISHDIPGIDSITFKRFMAIVNEYPSQTLSLNIKSDGLQKLIKTELGTYLDYFCFDMSVPDSIGYLQAGLTMYTRFSDVELQPSLLNESTGVWLDSFYSNELNVEMLGYFLQQEKKVVLVSPELHGYEYESYWLDLLKFLKINHVKLDMIGICTDKPLEAKELFSNVK